LVASERPAALRAIAANSHGQIIVIDEVFVLPPEFIEHAADTALDLGVTDGGMIIVVCDVIVCDVTDGVTGTCCVWRGPTHGAEQTTNQVDVG